jgi:hypothetical protein
MGGRQLFVAVGAALGFWPTLAGAQVTVAQAQGQVVEPLVPAPVMVPLQPGAIPATTEPPRGTTVLLRPRPETDPQGTRLGSFFFFPRLQLDETYNDNIFGTANQTTSDFITTVSPSFDLLSNWNQDALNLHAGGAFGTYASNSSEDFRDAFLSGDGRLDIDEGRQAYGGMQVSKQHESRYSPNSPGAAAEPVKYMNYGGNLGFSQTGLRVGYSADFTLNRFEYEAPPAVGGGFVPQSDRNNTTPDLALRGSYEFAENIQAYIRGEGNYRAFDHGASAASPSRTSAGYRLDTGLHADLTGVTVADVYVGYLQQFYASSAYSTFHGIDFGAKVTWNPTTLDTIRVGVDRTVQDLNSSVLAPGQVSSGYLETVISATEDHELLRNLIISGNVSFTNDAFGGINRTDNLYGLGVGARYLMNRYLYLGFTYGFAHRESTGAQAINPFNDNVFMLRLSTQL